MMTSGYERKSTPSSSIKEGAAGPVVHQSLHTSHCQPLNQRPHQLSGEDQAQLEQDKRAIYKHPLFPLLALLFEKCELATQSPECPSSDSFNVDIQTFVQHQQRDKKPFFGESEEVNELMIRSIQVLRIHLLELEKVQELCKDFCNRYITCLKGKMQSENLLRTEYGGYESDESEGRAPPPPPPSSRGAPAGSMYYPPPQYNGQYN